MTKRPPRPGRRPKRVGQLVALSGTAADAFTTLLALGPQLEADLAAYPGLLAEIDLDVAGPSARRVGHSHLPAPPRRARLQCAGTARRGRPSTNGRRGRVRPGCTCEPSCGGSASRPRHRTFRCCSPTSTAGAPRCSTTATAAPPALPAAVGRCPGGRLPCGYRGRPGGRAAPATLCDNRGGGRGRAGPRSRSPESRPRRPPRPGLFSSRTLRAAPRPKSSHCQAGESGSAAPSRARAWESDCGRRCESSWSATSKATPIWS